MTFDNEQIKSLIVWYVHHSLIILWGERHIVGIVKIDYLSVLCCGDACSLSLEHMHILCYMYFERREVTCNVETFSLCVSLILKMSRSNIFNNCTILSAVKVRIDWLFCDRSNNVFIICTPGVYGPINLLLNRSN